MSRLCWVPICGILIASTSSSAAVTLSLSLSEVAARARQRAPAVQAAALDVSDAEADRAGAVFVDDNPNMTAMAGPRLGAAVPDAQLTLAVPFALGAARARRLAAVDAGVARARAAVVGAERAAVAAAVAAGLRSIYAQKRLALAHERAAIAAQIVATVVERERAGDAAVFDVALAKADAARAAAAVAGAERDVVDAAFVVAAALDEDDVVVNGDLEASAVVAAVAVADDAAVVVAEAGVAAAKADVDAAEGSAWPALSAQAQYNFDDGDHIALAGLGVTLPLFESGQHDRARTAVALRRAEATRDRVVERRAREQRRALAAHGRAAAALRALDDDAVPLADDNAARADAAWVAGKIDLSALLLLRRAALETREEHLARRLDAALCALDVVVAGAPLSSGEVQ